MAFKVEVDQETCIGCGACVTQCDNFEMKEGKSYAKKKEVEEFGCNKDAAEICPVDAIKVTEIK
jgi:ferredoxin